MLVSWFADWKDRRDDKSKRREREMIRSLSWRLEQARKALSFYAQVSLYPQWTMVGQAYESQILRDQGRRAQNALCLSGGCSAAEGSGDDR